MASQLIGLRKTLQWSDFTTQNTGTPGAGQFAIGAETHAGINQNNITSKVESIPGSSPTRYRVKDDITITVTFGADSWVEQWVLNRDRAFQDRLLSHEQGHYNIVALLARDTFLELMQLKSQTFNTNMDAQRAIARAWTEGTSKAQAIQDLYDEPNQSHHGDNASGQGRWDGFINTAFTQPRTPALTTPDGVPYKVTLRSVLTGAGLTF